MSSTSLTFLLYHIVFSVKNREQRLTRIESERLYPYMGGIIKNLGGTPIIINGTRDHVHILCFLPRHISLSEAVKVIKAKSSLFRNRELAPQTPPLHWQDGFGIFTVASEQLEKVKNYIVEQDIHHLNRGFDEEWQILQDKIIEAVHKAPAMVCENADD
ncbi:MAG: IS200/IS605 family transposase [Candidatus Cloacimonetes bacterium]|nr:IS200/IS605 family transposase [Candidatus Cloacimonadota bacterium]